MLRPQECPHCGFQEFAQAPVSVQRHQVAQLVERPIEVVEYQRHTLSCTHCGQSHTAAWPSSIVPEQDLSVELQALLVWLGNYGHLSYEKQQELLRELGNIDIGVGTLQATNNRVAEAVEESVASLREWVKQQRQVHVDESPWPVLGLKEWLWVTTGQEFCLFHAGDTRSRAELTKQLGEGFNGVLCSDDYSVYNGYPVNAQQKCLAHLRRHFKKVFKLGHGNNPALGQAFLDLIDEAEAKHRQWRQTQDTSAYKTWAEDFKLRVTQSIQQWIGQAGYEAGLLVRALRDKAEQWWYFQGPPEVPPDNNLAERSLRLAVTKRKVSGGSRSMDRFAQTADLALCDTDLSRAGTFSHGVLSVSSDGSVEQCNIPAISVAPTDHLNPYVCGGSRSMDGFGETADLLSVIQTCRAQGRSVIEFFKQALQSMVSPAMPKPSLIPQT